MSELPFSDKKGFYTNYMYMISEHEIQSELSKITYETMCDTSIYTTGFISDRYPSEGVINMVQDKVASQLKKIPLDLDFYCTVMIEGSKYTVSISIVNFEYEPEKPKGFVGGIMKLFINK